MITVAKCNERHGSHRSSSRHSPLIKRGSSAGSPRALRVRRPLRSQPANRGSLKLAGRSSVKFACRSSVQPLAAANPSPLAAHQSSSPAVLKSSLPDAAPKSSPPAAANFRSGVQCRLQPLTRVGLCPLRHVFKSCIVHRNILT